MQLSKVLRVDPYFKWIVLSQCAFTSVCGPRRNYTRYCFCCCFLSLHSHIFCSCNSPFIALLSTVISLVPLYSIVFYSLFTSSHLHFIVFVLGVVELATVYHCLTPTLTPRSPSTSQQSSSQYYLLPPITLFSFGFCPHHLDLPWWFAAVGRWLGGLDRQTDSRALS